jgi:hypothetical protein
MQEFVESFCHTVDVRLVAFGDVYVLDFLAVDKVSDIKAFVGHSTHLFHSPVWSESGANKLGRFGAK